MARILVVDDDREIVKMFCRILEKEGFATVAAVGGKEGLAMARSEIPDLILLDVNMPDMDGGNVFQRLASDPVTEKIPVVFLTSLVSEQEAMESRYAGRRYLSKYSQPAEIVKRVKEILIIEQSPG